MAGSTGADETCGSDGDESGTGMGDSGVEPETGGGPGDDGTTGGGRGGDGSTSSSDGGQTGEPGGCSCTATPRRGDGTWWLLAVAGLWRRRRRAA